MFHLLGDDGETVRQHLTTNIANFFYHVDIECQSSDAVGNGLGTERLIRVQNLPKSTLLFLHMSRADGLRDRA